MGLKTKIGRLLATFRPDENLKNGLEFLATNEFHKAREIFKIIIEKSNSLKSKKTALAGLAATHMSFHNCGAEKSSEAIQSLKYATSVLPNEEDFWLALGDCWLDVKVSDFDRGDECKKAFQKVIQLNQSSADAYYGLGMLNQHLGDMQDARVCYERALDLRPGHATAAFRLWLLEGEPEKIKRNLYDYYDKEKTKTIIEIQMDSNRPLTPLELEAIRKTQKYGTVIFRQGIPSASISDLKKQTVEFATKYEFKKNTSIPFEDAPDELRKKIDEVIQKEIFQKIMPKVSFWSEKGWQSMPNPAKWIQYFPPKTGRATPFHLDHPVVCQESDWTTFWVALTDSGPGVAPSLGICRIPLYEPIDCEEQNIGRINPVPISKIMDFFGDAMVRPSFRAGDVACFGRYMLHCTVFDEAMKQERLSFDFRYVTGPARFSGVFAQFY